MQDMCWIILRRVAKDQNLIFQRHGWKRQVSFTKESFVHFHGDGSGQALLGAPVREICVVETVRKEEEIFEINIDKVKKKVKCHRDF